VLLLCAAGGSAVAVLRTDKPGRVTQTTPCVRGHKSQVTSFDLSQFDPQLLATGSADGNVKLWRLPDEGLKSDVTEPALDLQTEGAFVSRAACLCPAPAVPVLTSVLYVLASGPIQARSSWCVSTRKWPTCW
jgi:WD40 repeat protein